MNHPKVKYCEVLAKLDTRIVPFHIRPKPPRGKRPSRSVEIINGIGLEMARMHLLYQDGNDAFVEHLRRLATMAHPESVFDLLYNACPHTVTDATTLIEGVTHIYIPRELVPHIIKHRSRIFLYARDHHRTGIFGWTYVSALGYVLYPRKDARAYEYWTHNLGIERWTREDLRLQRTPRIKDPPSKSPHHPAETDPRPRQPLQEPTTYVQQ